MRTVDLSFYYLHFSLLKCAKKDSENNQSDLVKIEGQENPTESESAG
jgi:hypothetical protein